MAAGGARCPLTWEGWGEAALCEDVFQSFCKQAVCVSLTLQAGLTNWDEPQQLCEGWLCTHRGLSWFILMFGWILHILGPFCNLFTSFFFKVAAWLLQFIMNASHFTSGSSDGRNSRSPGGQRHYFPLVFLSFQHIFVTLKKHEFWIWCTLIDFTLNKSNCPSTFPFSFLSPFPFFVSFLCPFALRVMFSPACMLELLQSPWPYQGLLSLAIALVFLILQAELWILNENEVGVLLL